jgi:hypothetical protein
LREQQKTRDFIMIGIMMVMAMVKPVLVDGKSEKM